MVESANSNKAGLKRYLNDKQKDADKNANKPKSQTTQDKEAIASKVFSSCNSKEWKGVKNTFDDVKELITQGKIANFPHDFNKLTKDDCRIANSVSGSDSTQGIKTFRLVYDQTENTTIYFPIVTKSFDKFELLKDRTISAQKNTLLTTRSTNNNSNTNDEELTEENNAHTQANEEQENVNLEEQSVADEYMVELEKMADNVKNGKSISHTQNNHHEYNSKENHHESKDIHEVNAHMQELEKIASSVENGEPIYYLNEHQKEDGSVRSHIQKHNTHNAEIQTHGDESTLEDLFRENTDINDHVEGPSHSNNHGSHLLGGDHDVHLLKPTEEEEDSMNNTAPLFSEFDYDVSPKNTATSTQEEGPHFHNTDIEDYDFFAHKRRDHENNQGRINRLDNNEATDINDVITSKAQPERSYFDSKHHPRVGGWSQPQPCSDEEKHTTIAYVTKMTLSNKVLGLLPSTQNIMSCAHQIVAGTNFSVIIQINNDICEAVYNVDLENIVHDLNKSYAQREVPCVDMYARHLF